VAEPRPGYELWRPNREKASSQSTKALCVFLYLVIAGLVAIITIGGWERLEGGTNIASALYAVLFLVFAIQAARWSRGALPLSAAFGVILLIFATLAVPAWFARDKEGLTSPMLSESLLGLLTAILIPVLLITMIVALVAFNQEWHIEEERKIEGHPAHEDEDLGGGYGEPTEVTGGEWEEPAGPDALEIDEGRRPPDPPPAGA
jgi:hypothetical protein